MGKPTSCTRNSSFNFAICTRADTIPLILLVNSNTASMSGGRCKLPMAYHMLSRRSTTYRNSSVAPAPIGVGFQRGTQSLSHTPRGCREGNASGANGILNGDQYSRFSSSMSLTLLPVGERGIRALYFNSRTHAHSTSSSGQSHTPPTPRNGDLRHHIYKPSSTPRRQRTPLDIIKISDNCRQNKTTFQTEEHRPKRGR